MDESSAGLSDCWDIRVKCLSISYTAHSKPGNWDPAINATSVFEPFGQQHWIAVSVTLVLAVSLPLAICRFAHPRFVPPIRKGLACFLLLYLTVGIVIRTQIYGLPLQEHLPLHLCGASIVLGAIMLWRTSYRFYEVIYFWGIGGAFAALLTPDLPVGFPHPLFILFFVGHGLAITTVLFATFVIGFRPRAASLGIALGATALYALLIYPVNILLDSNYLYLLHKPERPSPLDYLGPWPWYILGLAMITVLSCVLCYLPFAGRHRNSS